MNKIVIWKDVLTEALSSDLQNQVMFGIDNCVRISKGSDVRDFIFHLQNVDVEKIADDDFWVVPVLPYEEDRRRRHDSVNAIYRRNSLVDTVAVKSTGAVLRETDGQKVLKPIPHLEFYRIVPGRRPNVIPECFTTDEDEMSNIVRNWEEIRITIEGFREEIRSKYC